MRQKDAGVERLKKMTKKKMNGLVKKAIKGDTRSFEELVRMNTETIVFASYSILRQHHDAEDATQEIIIKMYKNIKNLKDPAAFNQWMHRIINTSCYNLYNSKKRKNEQMDMDDHIIEIEEQDKEFLPQAYAEDKEYKKMIRDLIDGLPYQKKRIVIMYYYDDLSYKEIAEILDIPVNTVASDLKRSKSYLKAELEKVSPINTAEVNKLAAVPVLSQILSEQAREIATPAIIKNVMTFTSSEVVAGTAVKSASILTVKNLLIGLTCTAVITGGTIAATGGLSANETLSSGTTPSAVSQAANFQPKGDIVFKDGGCECGHINPKEIAVVDENSGYESADWVIRNKSTNEEYRGSGTSITKEVRDLYENKLDGEYTVIFTLRYPQGDLSIDNDFQISHDKIMEDEQIPTPQGIDTPENQEGTEPETQNDTGSESQTDTGSETNSVVE